MEDHGSMSEMRSSRRIARVPAEGGRPAHLGDPRLVGSPKAALVRIQGDEYGDGTACRMHQQLFAETMRALGLDPTYGAYLDALPGTTLATVNLISLFGLHRRWRGALVVTSPSLR